MNMHYATIPVFFDFNNIAYVAEISIFDQHLTLHSNLCSSFLRETMPNRHFHSQATRIGILCQ